MAIGHTEAVMAFLDGQAELGQIGIDLTIGAGEYQIRARGDRAGNAYFTSDLEDAISRGRIMAEAQRQKEPPLGPTGRRHSRKGAMYRHNAKIAAQRRARGQI